MASSLARASTRAVSSGMIGIVAAPGRVPGTAQRHLAVRPGLLRSMTGEAHGCPARPPAGPPCGRPHRGVSRRAVPGAAQLARRPRPGRPRLPAACCTTRLPGHHHTSSHQSRALITRRPRLSSCPAALPADTLIDPAPFCFFFFSCFHVPGTELRPSGCPLPSDRSNKDRLHPAVHCAARCAPPRLHSRSLLRFSLTPKIREAAPPAARRTISHCSLNSAQSGVRRCFTSSA